MWKALRCCNPNPNPDPNPTKKQHAIVNINSTKYSHMSYVSR